MPTLRSLLPSGSLPRLLLSLAAGAGCLVTFGVVACGGDRAEDPSGSAEPDDPKILVMGVNYWPPYLYPSSHENAPGLAQEILDRCVAEAGYRMEYRDSDVPEIFASLQDGSFDVHVLSYKDERAEYLHYGEEPLFEAAYRAFVAAGSDIEIESLEDFDGLRLGHKRNMRYTDEFLDYVGARRAEGSLVELESENEIVQQLASGEIDIAVMMLSSGMRRAAALGLLDQLKILDYDVKTATYPLAVSKWSRKVDDAGALLETFDACIREMEASGEMESLVDGYAHVFGD